MPGFLVHVGASVICAHPGGQAQPQPTAPNPRVRVAGQPIATLSGLYDIKGCSFNPGAPSPCLTARWTSGATKIRAGGDPVALSDSQAVCAPNGTPLLITKTQTRVSGI